MRRLEAYEALTAPLAPAWATLGWWSPSPSARIATALMGHLAAVRDRGSGVRQWLDLCAYPALLLFYAFGLGAMTARRNDHLALLLEQPLLDARKKLRPAVLELNHAAVVSMPWLVLITQGRSPRSPKPVVGPANVGQLPLGRPTRRSVFEPSGDQGQRTIEVTWLARGDARRHELAGAAER